jgi:hypothetical protein
VTKYSSGNYELGTLHPFVVDASVQMREGGVIYTITELRTYSLSSAFGKLEIHYSDSSSKMISSVANIAQTAVTSGHLSSSSTDHE